MSLSAKFRPGPPQSAGSVHLKRHSSTQGCKRIDPRVLDGSELIHLLQATAQLNKEFYKNPACIPALASIIASSPEQAVGIADLTLLLD